MRKVQIVYYLSHGGGLLEHPHLLEVSTSSTGLLLRDVKTRLSSLRGNLMPSHFSWSYKRSYKQGYVWHDLESDNDPIFPTHDGSEYVLIGCKIESPCTVQTLVSSPKTHRNGIVSINNVPIPMQLPSGAEDANKKMAGGSENASLHVCGDNIIVKLGNTGGLENLHVDQERPHSKAMEQSNLFPRSLDNKQSSLKKHALKGQIVPHYGSEFTVITKAGCSGASYNASPYGAVADAATQTGEDDEPPMQTKSKSMIGPYADLSHYELPRLPTQATGLLASTSREGMFSTHRIITEMELSREEISPPPCSTTSSTITSSAHSTLSSNTLYSLEYPKASLDQSNCLDEEDQILQEKDSLLSASGDESAYNAYSEEPTSTAINGSTYGGHNRDNMFCLSEDSQLPKLDSSTIKPHHAVSICSSSGRFLHLVSCGGGLDVINPTRRNASVSHEQHVVRGEETSASAVLPLRRDAKNDAVCMHRSGQPNASSDNAQEVGPSLPYVTSNVSSGICLSRANRDYDTASSFQEASSSTKKLWHLKGWVDSQCKKIKSLKGGIKLGSSTTSATIEDSYACLDLYEKHEANSSTKETNVEETGSHRRLSSVGIINHSSRLHHIM